MANDLVVQLGAKLDQFASDMNQAGDMADSAISRIEQSFASLNPGLGGFASLGLSITGVIGTVTGLMTALVGVNGQLADLQKNAVFSNVSTDRFQQIQYAAGQGGVSNSQSTTDLTNVSKLLADANYNENSLTKLLDENNIKYKDRNGQVISLNQLLTIAGGLLGKFDSIPDKTKAAQMLGLSQGWVEALRNGPKAFEDIAQSADDAGVIIDAQTVAKAAAFDRAWKASSALLSAQFKSAAADAAGYLDDLIDKANEFVAALNKANGTAAGSGQGKFDSYADALDIVRKDSVGAAQDVDQLTRVIERMVASGSGDPEIIAGLELIRAKAELAAKMVQSVAQKQTNTEFPSGVPLPATRPAAANTPTGTGKLPTRGGDSKDAVDQAIDSLTKHTLATEADAAAVDKGASALAGLRVDALETAAVLKNGGKETDAQADAFGDLRDKAIAAADALAKAKVASDISRGTQTAFLTPEDLAIANQLKGIYGDDIPAALNSAEASALRFNYALKQISDLGQDVNRGFLVDFETQIRNGASAMQALQTAGLNALGKIADKLASMAADQLWASAFGGTSGLGGIIGSLFGGSGLTSTGAISGAVGPTSIGGAALHFASGTDFAPGGLSLVGENGPELLNIPRGSQVIPNDVLRQGGGSNGNVTVGGATVVIQGDASEKTVALIKAALMQHDATLQPKVVAAVTLARKQRQLA